MNNDQTPYLKTKQQLNKPYTQIYLIRHCDADRDKKDELGDLNIPLTKVGIKQRKHLNKKLQSIKVNKIYSSQYKRAQQTAELFAEQKRKKINITPRLNETDWLEWHRVKYFNMAEKNRSKSLKNYSKLDQELNQYQADARRLLGKIWRENKGKNIACFCHGNIIRSLLTSILNTDIIGFLSMEIFQSSISKVVIDKGGYVKINYINSIHHLPHRPTEDLFKAALNK